MPTQSPVKDSLNQNPSSAPSAGAAGPSIVDVIPLKMVMMLASPYIAGRNADDALKRSAKLFRENGYCSTIDILGEDARVDEDCDRSVYNYKRLIDMVAAAPLDCARKEQKTTVSFKPSMFSTVTPGSDRPNTVQLLSRAAERIEDIVAHAKAKDVRVTLEAEDHRWADFHLDTYFSLINAGYENLGTVLQSRLFRTQKDVLRFDERMRVRMVIGIYNEPSSIAETQKPIMKQRAVEYAAQLLKRGTYVELASHDTSCVDNFFLNAVIPSEAPAHQFETQFLLGVPRKDLQDDLVSGAYAKALLGVCPSNRKEYVEELAEAGTIVRMYLPFGTEDVAGPYCKRRLKANPNMISYGIKNLFHFK
ncbi:MAG: proline dehydrogenase family protein [Candidatus Obscuribacterales bacterium]|nr:proline dehydrogenase family protein [Candidatus Obscuribacterales bacterium]